MANYIKTDAHRTQPLPTDFESALRTIDERLAEAARRSPVPMGLSERVFEASASLLPQRASRFDRGQSRGQSDVRSFVFPRLSRSRLAMAASLAMACGVAVWFLQAPSRLVGTDRLAGSNGYIEGAAPGGIELALAFHSLPTDSTTQRENEYAYLVDTSEVTYPDDLQHGLALLVRELEM